MGNIRKKYDAILKAKIALEAVKGEKTIAEISSEYGVHSTQIAHWKKQLLEELPSILAITCLKPKKKGRSLRLKLTQQIGQLKVELEWLKKKSTMFSR